MEPRWPVRLFHRTYPDLCSRSGRSTEQWVVPVKDYHCPSRDPWTTTRRTVLLGSVEVYVRLFLTVQFIPVYDVRRGSRGGEPRKSRVLNLKQLHWVWYPSYFWVRRFGHNSTENSPFFFFSVKYGGRRRKSLVNCYPLSSLSTHFYPCCVSFPKHSLTLCRRTVEVGSL